MNDSISIEICVDSAPSAIAAERGGADRVELCSDLLEGGIAPSAGLIELVRSRISVGLQIMIRPRGGDFCYSADEFETMRRDILFAKKLGANGVVLGILLPDGTVDIGRTRQLVDVSRPLNVTFHRAFDLSSDLFRALEDICDAGADRILTSGAEDTATDGAEAISRLVQASRGRVAIMACGSIREHNVASIVEQTGIHDIHTGLRPAVACATHHRDPKISLGTVAGLEYESFQVREEDVRRLRDAVAQVRV